MRIKHLLNYSLATSKRCHGQRLLQRSIGHATWESSDDSKEKEKDIKNYKLKINIIRLRVM